MYANTVVCMLSHKHACLGHITICWWLPDCLIWCILNRLHVKDHDDTQQHTTAIFNVKYWMKRSRISSIFICFSSHLHESGSVSMWCCLQLHGHNTERSSSVVTKMTTILAPSISDRLTTNHWLGSLGTQSLKRKVTEHSWSCCT